MPESSCVRCKDRFDVDELIRGRYCEWCWEEKMEEKEGRVLAVDVWMRTLRERGGWWR